MNVDALRKGQLAFHIHADTFTARNSDEIGKCLPRTELGGPVHAVAHLVAIVGDKVVDCQGSLVYTKHTLKVFAAMSVSGEQEEKSKRLHHGSTIVGPFVCSPRFALGPF